METKYDYQDEFSVYFLLLDVMSLLSDIHTTGLLHLCSFISIYKAGNIGHPRSEI